MAKISTIETQGIKEIYRGIRAADQFETSYKNARKALNTIQRGLRNQTISDEGILAELQHAQTELTDAIEAIEAMSK